MKKQHLVLTEEDLAYLESLLSKGSLKVRVQKRILALKKLHSGMTYQAVSDFLEIRYNTVLGWAKRYKTEGLQFLTDKHRSGRPIKISGEDRAKVTALACSDPPEGYARWSLRLLSTRLVELEIFEDISHMEVGRILKKMNYSLTEKNNGASGN